MSSSTTTTTTSTTTTSIIAKTTITEEEEVEENDEEEDEQEKDCDEQEISNVTITVKHNGHQRDVYTFPFPIHHTFFDLKNHMSILTRVPIENQKWITKCSLLKQWINQKNVEKQQQLSSYLSSSFDGDGDGDDDEKKKKNRMTMMMMKKKFEFMLIGTANEFIFKDPCTMVDKDLPFVLNDLIYTTTTTTTASSSSSSSSSAVKNDDEKLIEIWKNENHVLKLKNLIQNVSIHLMNEPRPGKKLVVLDIDYTIFDCKDVRTSDYAIEVHMRPFVHEFLTKIYQNFDIVFWSQTKWLWVESKLTDMGILTHENYKINFVLDKTSMFKVKSVKSEKEKKKEREHYVKPLHFIFAKFPQFYHERNTVHVDDLSRNFVMNPKNGIKIAPFKNCVEMREKDRELKKLSLYLNHVVAHADDVRACNHRKWKEELKKYCTDVSSSSSSRGKKRSRSLNNDGGEDDCNSGSSSGSNGGIQ